MAIIGAVSCLDSYFVDRWLNSLVPYLRQYEVGDKLADFMTKNGVTLRDALNLLKEYRPRLVLRRRLEARMDKFVAQKIDVINDIFGCYGLKEIVNRAASKSKDKHCLTRFNAMIERRHSIVHNFDRKNSGLQKSFSGGRSKGVLLSLVSAEKLIDAVEEILVNRKL